MPGAISVNAASAVSSGTDIVVPSANVTVTAAPPAMT
jgi:hypothetical protein